MINNIPQNVDVLRMASSGQSLSNISNGGNILKNTLSISNIINIPQSDSKAELSIDSVMAKPEEEFEEYHPSLSDVLVNIHENNTLNDEDGTVFFDSYKQHNSKRILMKKKRSRSKSISIPMTNLSPNRSDSKSKSKNLKTYKVNKGRSSSFLFMCIEDNIRWIQDYYTIGEPIGKTGNFGAVYECWKKTDINKTKKYAVKKIFKAKFYHINQKERTEMIKHMKNEILIQKKLKSHENIVQYVDTFEDTGQIHVVMEYIAGPELFDRIRNNNMLTEQKASIYLKQILNALHYMSKFNICHLDLKPDNIMFESETSDVIKIIDFGMSEFVPRLRKLKLLVGTPYYTAPEVLNGFYDISADIWSCGVILFVMLFGYQPFDPDANIFPNNDKIHENIKKGFIPETRNGKGPWFPSDIEVSDQAKDLITKMLKININERNTILECLNHSFIRVNNHDKKLPLSVFSSLLRWNKTNKFKSLLTNTLRKKLNPTRYHDIITVFKKWDTNNDGKISLKEFKAGMKEATDLSDNEIDQVFNNIDVNHKMEITFNELISIALFDQMVSVDERLYEAFSKFDTDHDGRIQICNLKKAINTVWQESFGNTVPKAEAVIKEVLSLKPKNNETKNDSKDDDDDIYINEDDYIDYELFLKAFHPIYNEPEINIDIKRLKTNGFGSFNQRQFDRVLKRLRSEHIIKGYFDTELFRSTMTVMSHDFIAPNSITPQNNVFNDNYIPNNNTGLYFGNNTGDIEDIVIQNSKLKNENTELKKTIQRLQDEINHFKLMETNAKIHDKQISGSFSLSRNGPKNQILKNKLEQALKCSQKQKKYVTALYNSWLQYDESIKTSTETKVKIQTQLELHKYISNSQTKKTDNIPDPNHQHTNNKSRPPFIISPTISNSNSTDKFNSVNEEFSNLFTKKSTSIDNLDIQINNNQQKN